MISHAVEHRPGDQPEDGQHVLFGNRLALEGDQLVEGRFGIPQPTLGTARDGQQRVLVNVDLFVGRDQLQALHDQRRRNTAQVEALAARDDRRKDLVRLCRGKNEFGVRGWLFEGFQQRVKRRHGEHVHLVNDVDFEGSAAGGILDGITQVPHLIHAVVRGTVDFHHIQVVAGGNFEAGVANIAGRRRRALDTVERLGENPGEGGFPDTARPHEQVSVRQPLAGNGVAQRLRDMILPHHVRKLLRTPFSRQYLVCHIYFPVERPCLPP